MKNQAVEPAVGMDVLTVQHWRERFTEAFGRFKNLVELAELLGKSDPVFDGNNGYWLLGNIKRGKGGLEVTAKAVLLMEQLRPADPKEKSRLSRQNLKQAF